MNDKFSYGSHKMMCLGVVVFCLAFLHQQPCAQGRTHADYPVAGMVFYDGQWWRYADAQGKYWYYFDVGRLWDPWPGSSLPNDCNYYSEFDDCGNASHKPGGSKMRHCMSTKTMKLVGRLMGYLVLLKSLKASVGNFGMSISRLRAWGRKPTTRTVVMLQAKQGKPGQSLM